MALRGGAFAGAWENPEAHTGSTPLEDCKKHLLEKPYDVLGHSSVDRLRLQRLDIHLESHMARPVEGLRGLGCEKDRFDIGWQDTLPYIARKPGHGEGLGHRPANRRGGPRFLLPLTVGIGECVNVEEARCAISRGYDGEMRNVVGLPVAGPRQYDVVCWTFEVARPSQMGQYRYRCRDRARDRARGRARGRFQGSGRPSYYPPPRPGQSNRDFRNVVISARQCR